MNDERWIIHVHERPAAVERVLGTLRRRAIQVSDLSVARASGSSLVVNVAVRVDTSVGARVTAELGSIPDAIAVERMAGRPPGGGTGSDGPPGHDRRHHHENGRGDGGETRERESDHASHDETKHGKDHGDTHAGHHAENEETTHEGDDQ